VGKAKGSTGPPQRPVGLTASLAFAWRGLRQGWMAERNLRIHVVAAWTILACAQILNVSRQETLFLMVSVAMVLAAELGNTSVELLTNLAAARYHPLAAAAKDTAAAMVLVTAAGALLVGLVVFRPYLSQLPALLATGIRSRPLLALVHGSIILTLALAGWLVPRRRP